MATKSSDMVEHPLEEKEIEERAKSDTPYFKLFVQNLKGTLKKSKPTGGDSLQALYFSTETNGLNFPADKVNGNISVIMSLKKGDQYGYIISNCVIPDTCLNVTKEVVKSKRVVRFTDSQKTEIKIRKDPRSETKFALYTSALDSKGHSKFFYLTPKSGTIMAEDSNSADGYYNFSLFKATLPGSLSQQKIASQPPAVQVQPTQAVPNNPSQTEQTPPEPSILHNLASFKKRAQSGNPLFWLRKHPKHPVSAGGYFFADKDQTNWYFDPERFDDKDWPSDEKAVLKVVYHKEKESDEGYYITIESALIPNRYLAVNLEQPNHQGNDKYYSLQFTSQEKVKWYRGYDTGETFSLYTYIREGAERTKFYCSLISELRQVVQVFATPHEENRMILDFGVPNPVSTVGRPLTLSELKQVTSTEYFQYFYVKFPGEDNQIAFVNTPTLMQFKPPSTKEPTSTLMGLLRVEKSDGSTAYIWSSWVTPPNSYLTTDVNYGYQPPYQVTFFSTCLEPPLWTAHEPCFADGLLGFTQTLDERTYCLKPENVPFATTQERPLPFLPLHIPMVVADQTPTPLYNIEIFGPLVVPFESGPVQPA